MSRRIDLAQLEQIVGASLDGLQPLQPLRNLTQRVTLRCQAGHEFERQVRYSAGRCPGCEQAERVVEHEQQVLAHGLLTPLEPFVDAQTQLRYRCNACHHEWRCSPYNSMKGCGCPRCNDLKQGDGRRKSHADWLAEIKALHGRRFKLAGRYTGAYCPIEVTCRACSYTWTVQARALTLGKCGCKRCRVANANHSRYRRKELTVKGRTYPGLRGYEPQAIEHLITVERRKPRCIVTGTTVPTFSYKMEGVSRRYFPDLHLTDDNTIVEVKSTFTAFGWPSVFEQLCLKRKAVLKAGYAFRLMLMQSDGTCLELPPTWYRKQRTTLLRLFA